MTTYRTRLRKREQVADATLAFHFDKPAGFAFKPGQAIDLVLSEPGADPQASRHAFSVVSAPFEDELVVATRMRHTAFKTTLGSLPIGAPAWLEGPFGSLTLHNNRARPAVFIAGGIGITPFMSILRQAAHDRLPQRISLLYSNRRPEDAAFLAELQQLERLHETFRLTATMTQVGKARGSWAGETRRIDEAMLRELGSGFSAPLHYLVGPPAMVGALRQALNHAGIDDDDIRSEEFYGY